MSEPIRVEADLRSAVDSLDGTLGTGCRQCYVILFILFFCGEGGRCRSLGSVPPVSGALIARDAPSRRQD